MTLGDVIAGISAWAATKPEIAKVYVFGSRVTGKSFKTGKPPRSASDLDVAVEMVPIEPAEAQLAFSDRSTAWTAELEAIVPWRVDLEWYHPRTMPALRSYIAGTLDCSGDAVRQPAAPR